MADNGHGIGTTDDGLAVEESAAQRHLDAEHPEVVAANDLCHQLRGAVVGLEANDAQAMRRERLDGLNTTAERLEVEVRVAAVKTTVGVAREDRDEPLRVRDGVAGRTHKRVDRGKSGGDDADAHRGRDHDDDGHNWRLHQAAACVAQVVSQSGENAAWCAIPASP